MSEMNTTNVRASVSGSLARLIKGQTSPAPAEQPRTDNKTPTNKIDMEMAVEQLKEAASQHATNLDFSVHEGTGRTIIKVIDMDTEKVVREIPPEEVLDLVKSIEDVSGQLLSTKA